MNNTVNQRKKIESDKATIQRVFTDFWFRVPEYQRSYVWQEDNIIELLDDIFYAAENTPNSEYFLGSLVLQKKYSNENSNISYSEFDILDGQQRLSTILMILAVIRDTTNNQSLKTTCSKFIHQEEDEFKQIPERIRLIYKIRDKVENFVNSFIKEDGGTKKLQDLESLSDKKNISFSNMAKGILCINDYFKDISENDIAMFAKHLFNNVIVIYVASEELEDAFRLFTILNNRGVPLTTADILKSLNLGAVSKETDVAKYAENWENLESELGYEEFNRLLSFIRTIYLKEKARENIVKEFEEKIYGLKNPIIKKGSETFDSIFEYGEIYKQLIFLEGLPSTVPNKFKNLIMIMYYGLPSQDWIPPLLAYYKKFKHENLLDFTIKLGNKFSADWILQRGPSTRINNMAIIMKAIEKSRNLNSLLTNEVIFEFSINDVKKSINEHIYKKRYSKYILLLLEYLKHDHSTVFPDFTKLSVEHILPQNPALKSKWKKQFSQWDIEDNVHKLGNLLLISRSKNSSLGRKDFIEKKKTYFTGYVSVFPNSLRVMQFNDWNLKTLQERQKESILLIVSHFKN